MKKPRRWRIGGLEKLTGVTRDAVHHYLRIGLLHPPERASATVAWFDLTHVHRLKQIRALRERGVSLAAIARLSETGSLPARAEDLDALGTLFGQGESVRVDGARDDVRALLASLALDPDGEHDARLVTALEAVLALDAPAQTLATALGRITVEHAAREAEALAAAVVEHLRATGDAHTARDAIDALREVSDAVRAHTLRRTLERSTRAHARNRRI